MIFQQHYRIGHLHDLKQQIDSIDSPVDHISENIECVVCLEPDLL